MPGLQTSYEFTLPRGYVDSDGDVHRKGRMRLATARDELEPLRDPSVTGPDDPRLTILVLARVVEKLGELGWVSAEHIEGLFTVDLAFLQDFYGVINFGTQKEYDALMAAQGAQDLVGRVEPEPVHNPWDSDEGEGQHERREQVFHPEEMTTGDYGSGDFDSGDFGAEDSEEGFAAHQPRPPMIRPTVEELPRVGR
jgi:hypothetical protein